MNWHFRNSIELLVGYGLILGAIWTPLPIQRSFMLIAVLWLFGTTFLEAQSATALGLGASGFWESLWLVLLALGLATITLLGAARLHTLHWLTSARYIHWVPWAYVGWSFVQQFLLQGYFLTRLLTLLRDRRSAIVLAAGLFSLAHIPNPVLTILTLVWGLVSCAIFLRYRNLYVLGLAHAILGLCVAFAVPNSVHHQMRVGLGYLQYHHQGSAGVQRSQRNQMVSTDAWVMADASSR